LHKTDEVFLTQPDREAIAEMLLEIEKIISAENCPPKLLVSKCRNCSYFDFCYAEE
jgi:CRISPR-associated exonuclease Cas4